MSCLDANEDILNMSPKVCPVQYTGTHVYAPTHDGTMSTLVTTCCLVVILAHFPPPPYPPTYGRGSKRLDYIYVSQDVIPSLESSGVLPLFAIFSGDHCACYVDINAHELFSDPTHSIMPTKHRGIQLHDPRKVDWYNEALLKQLDYHKVFQKLDSLQQILKHPSGTKLPQIPMNNWTTLSQNLCCMQNKLFPAGDLHNSLGLPPLPRHVLLSNIGG